MHLILPKTRRQKSIKVKGFEKINCLPIHERLNQCPLSCIYKFHAKKATDYMDEISLDEQCNGYHTCYSY